MTIQQAYNELLLQLYEIYDDKESANIANWVIEYLTDFKKIDRIINKNFILNTQQVIQFADVSKELATRKPVQYVLGEAYFYGLKLKVNEHVLIPRPETEELVEWVIESYKGFLDPRVIDVGTGSGCIPIALKRTVPNAFVTALDISEDAIEVARENAAINKTDVDFVQFNFLDEAAWPELGSYDCIVSNPPYIRQYEAKQMHENVLAFEPHLALFVPDDEPLLFYKALAHFSQNHLTTNGFIFLEINEALAAAVYDLYSTFNYTSIEVKKDMQGKDRMVKIKR